MTPDRCWISCHSLWGFAILAVVIGWLSGIVLEREPGALVLDVNGVGYEIAITAEMLGSRGVRGDELALWIHAHATSESPAPLLYGFISSEQRKLFRLLLRVKGIGPRLAQAVVAHLGAEGVANAVRQGDVARLCTVSGVGKKTGHQIILDLAGHLDSLEVVAPQVQGELARVASALGNLGFKRVEVDRALRILRDRGDSEGAFDEVLRRALALLREM